MTQELIIAVLLLGLTGLVWTMTLASFTEDRSPRKDSGVATSLPDSEAFSQGEGTTQSSQINT